MAQPNNTDKLDNSDPHAQKLDVTGKADEILTKVANYGLSQGQEGSFLEPWDLVTPDEAKQQLADGLAAALPIKHHYKGCSMDIYKVCRCNNQKANDAIDQTEAAIYAYFGIGRNQDGDSK